MDINNLVVNKIGAVQTAEQSLIAAQNHLDTQRAELARLETLRDQTSYTLDDVQFLIANL